MRRMVVTGASSGIGLAVARRAHELGWAVAGIDRVFNSDNPFPGHMSHIADVTDGAAVSAAVAAITSSWGGAPNALVHCAGIYRVAPTVTLDPADWDHTLNVNARGSFLVAQAVAARMISDGNPGSIVLLGSVGAGRGDLAEPGAAYAASKGAVSALVRQLAVEWGPAGIRVNSVVPGVIDTAMTTVTSNPDAADALLGRLPLGRLGTADEVAAACVFLAGPDSSYITGTEITVDGGYLAS
ncbi:MULTISPECIES: SDR family NAD(P)-dependent oxidoreductase [unclassified Mycolicibacterium]|uniref:SDR family NAD(P)-dependent oxidoreductase n=1 Tax=unclassified Mycolicibacterium TaxID=2636767 RepID=UPI0012DD33F1|nr:MULTISPECIES: SDR family oxidoreductase [unclassified Mycolicibacterium]MUL81027.1 SDR family oxidoreductase [Mycolicibacterium sp. CBMA 329]MUL86793.1 SDR family oxidoreductase [Mycolicibacterium sp. CBMA 331]MUL98922.1 SDR family oxidoreductase [Mycolicibacterium sp. CBMA 334]MUM28797.1 SDR family oxidoreductase [Mycolicibacterium sp. CBMA 295]MUM37090.1 SDR family oxidoreductase [Mycolicibacterium sp. CBMA 247]